MDQDKSLSDDQIITHRGKTRTFYEDAGKEARAVLKKLRAAKSAADMGVSRESIEQVAHAYLALYKEVLEYDGAVQGAKRQARLEFGGGGDGDVRDDDGPFRDAGAAGDNFQDDFDT